MASTSSSSRSSQKIHVTCFSDFQNAWILKKYSDYDLSTLRNKIEEALKKLDTRFVVESDDLIAIGPGDNADAKRISRAGIKVLLIADLAIKCDEKGCNGYAYNNKKVTEVKLLRKMDAADFDLVKMMHLMALGDSQMKNILLIAGDGDYGYCMKSLSNERDVFLILAESANANQELRTYARATWRWFKFKIP